MLKKQSVYPLQYKNIFFFICFFLVASSDTPVFAQIESPYNLRSAEPAPSWVIEMYKADADPGVVMKMYDTYYKNHPFVKNQHTQYYKRWISGFSKNVVANPFYDSIYLNSYFEAKNQRVTSNWNTVGPIDWDHTAAATSYAPGSAHVYTIEQSISNPDILYAGAANAGVWRSTDRGVTWTAKTDDFLTGGVTSVEIDPTNADIIYAELLSSIYKSSNGGNTWLPTGDAAFMALSLSTRDIRCKPDEPLKVYAATSQGLFRSINGGNTWTNVLSGNMQEIEFHPIRHDTMYAVRVNGDKTEFFRSFNDGVSFTLQTSGWPAPNTGAGEHQRRTELAVTLAAPDKVYALATGSANGGSGLYGVYVSSNLGATWTFKCCGPQPAGPPSASNMNLMGWSDEGLDDGGQYYYDLAFGVSPFNKDSIWVCGVNLWVSGNEGASFVCPAKWSHSYKPNYVHADIHDLHYMKHTGELWVSGDGGIFYSDDVGANFYRRNVGIAGSDFWGFGMGHWFGNVMIGGAYHNGTLMREEDTYINGWICTDGGDGVGGYVNPGFDRQAYSNYNIKQLQSNRTISPVTREFQFQPNSTYITGRSSDLLFHPRYYGTWFSGSGTKFYKTQDNGFTFEELYDFGADVASMDLCQANPDAIYACTFPDWWGIKRIYRSLNGGYTWVEITPPGAVLNNSKLWIPYDIAVDATDPMKVWIVRTSMYNEAGGINGNIVYRSDDGGANWINISGTMLNSQSPTCILHQKGTNGGIYIGTRNSVYYRNDAMSEWELYSNGLPARTHSVKILPWFRNEVIRNATDRSVWESPFFESSSPIAVPAVQKQYLFCERDTAYFTDLSVLSETGATWLWNFQGGTPSVSTIRNPKVIYKKPGIYEVSLTVGDIHGLNTATIPGMIIADNKCAIDTLPGGCLDIASSPGYVKVDGLNLTTETLTITAWIRPDGIQNEYSGIWMNDGAAAGFNFREANNTLAYHWPGGAWWWDSNLTVPAGEWSYIAMVVQPGFVTLYVNGVSATHATAVQAVNLNNIRIGSYQGWGGRNFKGEIEELCVWHRALTQDEIRLQRHLTKQPENDPTLIGYYQFDMVASGQVIDKANGRDGTVFGNANLISSNAPVGSGSSEIQWIQNSGNASFSNGGDMSIGFQAPNPNGHVVVSHLRVLPDTLPTNKATQGGYWIINNYGTNPSLTGLDSVALLNAGSISHTMANELEFSIYARSSNASGPVWSNLTNDTIVSAAGLKAIVNGYDLSSVTTLGQFLIMRDSMPSGIPDVTLTTADQPDPLVPGGGSMSLFVQSDHQAIRLPMITLADINAMGAPVPGQMAYLVDSSSIVYCNGIRWLVLNLSPVLQNSALTIPDTFGTLSFSGDPAEASTLLKLENGFINLPSFTSAALLDVSLLSPGMLVYDASTNKLRFYNGSEWQILASTALSLQLSNSPPAQKNGMAINQSSKHPSSVLDIHPLGGKAFQLPIVNPDQIFAPVPGLLCFNPANSKLMLFDGANWNVVK